MVSHLVLVGISANESAMALSILDCHKRLQVLLLLFVNEVDTKSIEYFVHHLHVVGVLHHS